jgi:hypothetical protein
MDTMTSCEIGRVWVAKYLDKNGKFRRLSYLPPLRMLVLIYHCYSNWHDRVIIWVLYVTDGASTWGPFSCKVMRYISEANLFRWMVSNYICNRSDGMKMTMIFFCQIFCSAGMLIIDEIVQLFKPSTIFFKCVVPSVTWRRLPSSKKPKTELLGLDSST